MLGELNQDQIEQVLLAGTIGRIGCAADGRIYVVPITYAYDGECVYAHAGEGMKLRMMRENPDVCFEVEQVDNLANWRSVIAWGQFEELEGREAREALDFLRNRLAPYLTSETSHHHDPDAASPGASPAVVLYRIALRKKTGRYEKR